MVRLVRSLAICLVASIASLTAARSDPLIEIKQAWSRATPNGSRVAAGYLTIENHGDASDRLIEVHSRFARKVDLHATTVDHGVTSMKPVDGGLLIPPGATTMLQPGGHHIMFVGLNAPFVEGQQVAVELLFEKAGKMEAALSIAAAGSLKPPVVGRSSLPVTIEPARASEDDFFTHLHGDRLMANVTVSPARRGDFEISVELEDTHEKPLAASAVSITLSDQKRGSSPVTANAERVRDDKWRVRMSAPTSGTWLLSLSVRTSPADQIEIAAPIVIN